MLLHHPPRVEDEKWRKRLTDGRALCAILGEEGAELILHGHGHRNAESGVPYAAGEIPVFGIPSASAIGHKPGREAQYRLYRIRRHGDAMVGAGQRARLPGRQPIIYTVANSSAVGAGNAFNQFLISDRVYVDCCFRVGEVNGCNFHIQSLRQFTERLIQCHPAKHIAQH